MSKKFNIIKKLFIGFILVTPLIVSGLNYNENRKYFALFEEIFERIDNDYVQKPDKDKMIESALKGMLSSLDPHSQYFNKEETEEMKNELKGEFGGIGVEIQCMSEGAIKVISPIDDLAAARAGIQPGDVIFAVNDEQVSELGCIKAVRNIKGEIGTKVKISVIRESNTQPLEFNLEREIVKMKIIKSNYDNDIMYVRLSTFSSRTFDELKEEVRKYKVNHNIKGIILDLRSNPGGLLDQAVSVSDYFLNSEKIVSIKGRSPHPDANRVYTANHLNEKAPKVPMIVLINRGSASASEIVAGALQDNKRAIIMGTKSFGKASVQPYTAIKDGSYKFTVALYYTPNDRAIQAEGIIPDIIVEEAKVEYPNSAEIEKKYHHESKFKNHLKVLGDKNLEKKNLKNAENKELDKSTPAKDKPTIKLSDMYYQDYQYAKAYDLLKGLEIINSMQLEY